MTLYDRLGPTARSLISEADKVARDLGQPAISSAHLVVAALAEPASPAARVLMSRAITKTALLSRLSGIAPSRTGARIAMRFDATTSAALATAMRLGASLSEVVSADLLVLAALESPSAIVSSLLGGFGQDPVELASELRELLALPSRGTGNEATPPPELAGVGAGGAHPAASRGPLSAPPPPGRKATTPLLDRYAVDLVAAAHTGKLDPVVGRETETEHVIAILLRRSKNNPVLVGEAGVGKTAVVEGLARRIASGTVPEELTNKRVWAIDLGALVGGTTYRGDFEDRLKKLIAELVKTGDLAFVDEIHMLVSAGAASGALGAGNLLKPALSRGEISLIGATTAEEYRKFVEADAAWERRFGKVVVEEPTTEVALEILKTVRPLYEAHHHVRFSDDALRAAVELTARHVPDRNLPDKAIDAIDEAGAAAAIALLRAKGILGDRLRERAAVVERRYARAAETTAKNTPEAPVSAAVPASPSEAEAQAPEVEEDVAEARLDAEISELLAVEDPERPDPGVLGAVAIGSVIEGWTGIPAGVASAEESALLLGLEERLRARVIGQDAAAGALARAMRRRRSGVGDRTRPPSFIFAGRTGVGKTEMARTLAAALFGDEAALVQIDMSEYMESHAVARLIGAPPGYVGHGEAGQLTETIRRKPYSVLLLDEIEKAHPDISNLLLQVLEAGRLTDSSGRVVHFEHCVVIMTSNAGAATSERRSIGFGSSSSGGMDEAVRSALKKTFRPELLNRVDEIICFNDLDRTSLLRIVDVLLARPLAQAADLGYQVHVSDEAKQAILEIGFDPTMGARPLRRAIQELVEDPLAEAMLAGLAKGPVELRVDWDDPHRLLPVPVPEQVKTPVLV